MKMYAEHPYQGNKGGMGGGGLILGQYCVTSFMNASYHTCFFLIPTVAKNMFWLMSVKPSKCWVVY